MKIAACLNKSCSQTSITTLDSDGDVGQYTSIAIGQDGYGLISYYDATNKDLKIAHCSNLACTNATVQTIDPWNVGTHTSVTIGSDGLGIISYYDLGAGDLKVAHCLNVVCNEADKITRVDQDGNVGKGSSIVLGVDGLALISYYDLTNSALSKALKLVHCSNILCSASTSQLLDTGLEIGENSSITIDQFGYILVSYSLQVDDYLEIQFCADVSCDGGNHFDLDESDDVGSYNTITTGSGGLGIIGYYDETNRDLKIAYCADRLCSESIAINILDSEGDVGQYPSITIDPYGLPLISYYDSTNGDLKIARCENDFCVPYFRRR